MKKTSFTKLKYIDYTPEFGKSIDTPHHTFNTPIFIKFLITKLPTNKITLTDKNILKNYSLHTANTKLSINKITFNKLYIYIYIFIIRVFINHPISSRTTPQTKQKSKGKSKASGKVLI